MTTDDRPGRRPGDPDAILPPARLPMAGPSPTSGSRLPGMPGYPELPGAAGPIGSRGPGGSGGHTSVVGTRFGAYTLVRKITESGVGEIFQARHTTSQEPGILKRLRSDRAGSMLSRRRFEFEMELGRTLTHPNLVNVRDSGVIDDRPCLFMEEVRGPSLRRILQGSAPWQVTTDGLLAALEQVARGVAFVHRAGVVHCDLKPENILFHAPHRPVVIDFGLAFRRGGPEIALDREDTRTTGYLMGTPAYMPPETITGKAGNATPQADIYSFGVMLYEVLAGRPPFVQESGSLRQASLMHLIEQVVHDTPAPLRQLRPDVADEWEVLCRACLQKKPTARPESLDRVAQDISAILRTGKPLMVTNPGLVKRITRWFTKPDA